LGRPLREARSYLPDLTGKERSCPRRGAGRRAKTDQR
jgi:hypothetical protein